MRIPSIVGVCLLLALSVFETGAQSPAVRGVVESVGTFKGGDGRIVIRIPKGVTIPFRKGNAVDVATPPAPPPPVPVDCQGMWSAWTPVSGAAGEWSACTQDVSGEWRQSRQETRSFAVSVPASNGGTACPASPESREFVQTCTPPDPPPPPPPPPSGTLFGVVDPSILGEYSGAEHDLYRVDGGDGYLYRTWHPQCPSSLPNGTLTGGRCFAHEHGDNPGNATQPDIVASLKSDPLAFGLIGRRHGDHDEPHEGFKVFLAKRGQVNDEQRTNLTDSLSVFHMGTGGPRRAQTQFHSNDLRVFNPDGGVGFIHTRLMMDTGDKFDNVCDPRTSEPTKDGFSIPNRCKVNSGYEIWSTTQCIFRANGSLVYCPRAVPAVFDPITVILRENPLEVVYSWDDRFKPYRNFPGDDWTGFRGCIRENYAQVGYSQNQGGPHVIYTDAMGREVAQTAPGAIKQTVPTINIVDHRSSAPRPGETAGNQAFKFKVDYCGTPAQKAKLGLKN